MKRSVKLRTLDVYLHRIGQKVFDICEAVPLSAHQELSDIISFNSLKSITFYVAFWTSFNYVLTFSFSGTQFSIYHCHCKPTGLLILLPINFSKECTTHLPFPSHLTSLIDLDWNQSWWLAGLAQIYPLIFVSQCHVISFYQQICCFGPDIGRRVDYWWSTRRFWVANYPSPPGPVPLLH